MNLPRSLLLLLLLASSPVYLSVREYYIDDRCGGSCSHYEGSYNIRSGCLGQGYCCRRDYCICCNDRHFLLSCDVSHNHLLPAHSTLWLQRRQGA